MRQLLSIIFTLLLPVPQGIGGKGGIGGTTGVGGGATMTLVQVHASAPLPSGTTWNSVAFTNNTVGNIGVVSIAFCVSSGTATISTITDSSGNTYTISAPSLATKAATHYSNCYTQFAYSTNLLAFTGTNTVTIVFSTGVSGTYSCYELTPGAFDQTNTNTGTSITPSAGTITTTTGGSFAIAVCILDDGFGFANGWLTPGTGWTLGFENGGGNTNQADEYRTQSTAGMLTGDFGSNFGISGPFAASMITFHP